MARVIAETSPLSHWYVLVHRNDTRLRANLLARQKRSHASLALQRPKTTNNMVKTARVAITPTEFGLVCDAGSSNAGVHGLTDISNRGPLDRTISGR